MQVDMSVEFRVVACVHTYMLIHMPDAHCACMKHILYLGTHVGKVWLQQ